MEWMGKSNKHDHSSLKQGVEGVCSKKGHFLNILANLMGVSLKGLLFDSITWELNVIYSTTYGQKQSSLELLDPNTQL